MNNKIDEALAADIINFLKKSWQVMVRDVGGAEARQGQQEVANYVTNYLQHFMQLMARQYNGTTRPADKKEPAQNIIWKNLSWSFLYNYLTKHMESSDGNKLTYKEVTELLKNPVMLKLEQSVSKIGPIILFNTPITINTFKDTNPISRRPYKTGGLRARYPAEDIAKALITLACEKLTAMDNGLDSDVDIPTTSKASPKKASPKKISATPTSTAPLGAKMAINIGNDPKGGPTNFVKKNDGWYYANGDTPAGKLDATIEKLYLEKTPVTEQILGWTKHFSHKLSLHHKQLLAEHVMNIVNISRDSELVMIDENNYNTITKMLECLNTSWRKINWKVMIDESQNGYIMLKKIIR